MLALSLELMKASKAMLVWPIFQNQNIHFPDPFFFFILIWSPLHHHWAKSECIQATQESSLSYLTLEKYTLLYQHTQCEYFLIISILKHHSFSQLLTFWLLADIVIIIKSGFYGFLSLTTYWVVKRVIIQTLLLLMFTFIFIYLFWYWVTLICCGDSQRTPKSLASLFQLIRESLKTSPGNLMTQRVCL